MSGFSEYRVEHISSVVGRNYIVDNHYTGTCLWRPMCWGLYLGAELVGVVAFGSPTSEDVRRSVFGPDHKDTVRELHRMHLKDPHPRNLTTWFLARALRALLAYRPNLRGIISFADAAEGHDGTVYRAANFLYCGMTGKDWAFRDPEGRLKHYKYGGVRRTKDDPEALEKGWTVEERGAKHRYILVIGPNKRERAKYLNLLKLEPRPFAQDN